LGIDVIFHMRGGSRKRFGQHFLAPAWADKLVAAIDPQPGDRFLEIGPGPGALTLRLAPRVEHLTAVEVDRDMIAALRPQVPANVDLIEADFLDIDLEPFIARGPLRVAGNLPYNISAPILFRLIDIWRRHATLRESVDAQTGVRADLRPWQDAIVMVQREVADRIQASPGSGDYGVMSISIQLHADVRRVLTLPPGAFRPPPKVHSAVVQLAFRAPIVALRDERVFEQMVRAVFSQRRKTLGNALAPFAISRHANARVALAAAGIDPTRRAETLQLAELARLADYFAIAGA
jgi:16S rRNA (adenine1518-N6/adenine1519-N6)-dimethyltransferase